MRVLFLSEAPLIKYGLARGFERLGHTTQTMYGNRRLWDKAPDIQEKLIESAIQEFEPNFVFTEGYAGLDINMVGRLLDKYNIPLMVWCIEDPVTTHIGNYLASKADLVWTTTVERVPAYEKMGKISDVLTFACNPEVHKTEPLNDLYTHDIVLVAANYSNRYNEAEWFIRPILDSGKYDIKIWGPWWDDPNRPIDLNNY